MECFDVAAGNSARPAPIRLWAVTIRQGGTTVVRARLLPEVAREVEIESWHHPVQDHVYDLQHHDNRCHANHPEECNREAVAFLVFVHARLKISSPASPRSCGLIHAVRRWREGAGLG